MGSECNNFIREHLRDVERHQVTLKVLNFYITLGNEMIKRLPLKYGIFSEYEFLSPEHAFNKNRLILNELPNLCDKYK
jgi:hypothetical protein